MALSCVNFELCGFEEECKYVCRGVFARALGNVMLYSKRPLWLTNSCLKCHVLGRERHLISKRPFGQSVGNKAPALVDELLHQLSWAVQ